MERKIMTPNKTSSRKSIIFTIRKQKTPKREKNVFRPLNFHNHKTINIIKNYCLLSSNKMLWLAVPMGGGVGSGSASSGETIILYAKMMIIICWMFVSMESRTAKKASGKCARRLLLSLFPFARQKQFNGKTVEKV